MLLNLNREISIGWNELLSIPFNIIVIMQKKAIDQYNDSTKAKVDYDLQLLKASRGVGVCPLLSR